MLNTICDWSSPEDIAIEYHNSETIKKISYSELSDAKVKIEAVLAGAVKNHQFVGINCDVKAPSIPALILGILSQGSAFVNLPSTGVREISSRIGLSFAFSQSVLSGANSLCEVDVHGETVKLLELETIDGTNNIDKNEFAFAITTSGSTGIPKVVKVPHASIVPNILELKQILRLSKHDKIAQLTKLTFDPSIVETFLSLSSGSTLFVVSKEVINNPYKLLNLIFEHEVTFLQTTPSLWLYRWSEHQLGNTIFGRESKLKVLLLGGEPLPKVEMFRTVKHPINQTKIYNIYGITEVSCWASINEININHNEVETSPMINQYLGTPFSETIFQVRSEKGDIVCDGEGVLYIGSDTRVCAINNEDLKHLETPVFRKTGDLVEVKGNREFFYKGRCDRTVKRFGNRVDLTELEQTVSKLNFVKNCLVMWDEKQHALYLCISTTSLRAAGGKFTDELKVQEELDNELRKLPSFYQPNRIKLFNTFPLTINGKICTRSLMKTFETTEKGRVQNSQKANDSKLVRKILLQLWKNDLKSTIDSGFLDSGGNSVKAMQIANELSAASKIEFPELIGLLLKNETLANCMDYVLQKIQSSVQITSNVDNIVSSSSSYTQFAMNKKRKYDVIQPKKYSHPNLCLWQKCRGRVTGENDENYLLPSTNLNLNIRSQLIVECTQDLKKCVDASPTIFKYSSGEIYTSVGSHAGLILTKQLNSHDSITYEINLPDRIEASVLVLDEFKGIVGCYDGYVYCLNLKSGQIIWKYKTGDTVKCTAATSSNGKSVFVGSYDKYFYNISIEDGQEIWRFKCSEGSISATPCTCLRACSVLFGTLDGTCMSLNQTSGEIIWKFKFNDPIFSAPAMLENEDIVFCSVSGEMKCFNSETGHEKWNYKIDGNVFSHLVMRKNCFMNTEELIIGSNNKSVYCLSIQTLSSTPVLKYSVTFECPIFATPYCERDVLIVADTGGVLSFINAFNGQVVTSLKLGGNIFSSPVINGEFLVVGCRDNNMYVVRIVG
ncbi:beta-alanine-activating enzyme [Neodiprion virginianus]|uniref:beta-alanine-activating enzyme n=1 Tax=Neodiprion virginianus TaxID=2961670 RepID=UPI001EE75E15|nr:beta-alanine-activating enzyme [Neodiprion virginianus]XP_046625978.1 beta-alanine-activating enzyme [Neodiprion virginianus]